MSDVFARQNSSVYGKRIEVPGESVAERLSETISTIKETVSSWYDGTIESVDRRMDLVRQGVTLARQARSGPEFTVASLSAVEIESSLESLYETLREAREEMALVEVDLPTFSINARST